MEGVGIFMEIGRMIALYMDYCRSKQLRPKTMLSYEQTIKLFARWLKEVEGIDQVEQIKEATIRHYILELQSRGKYSATEKMVADQLPHNLRHGEVMLFRVFYQVFFVFFRKTNGECCNVLHVFTPFIVL